MGQAKKRLVKKPATTIRTVPYSEVDRETVEWFWERLIPFGMLTLLVGDPGLGKSLLTNHLAAIASRKGLDVILLSAEDHKGATIRPRLEAAGADLERVHHLEVRRHGVEDGLVLPEDGGKLERLARKVGAKLIIVDPLTAHLDGSVNSWRDQSVRAALAPLHRAAERIGSAVLVVAHLNKGAGQDPLYRTGGSIGLPAAVRSAILLARNPDDEKGELGAKRILAHIKCNVAPQSASRECEVRSKAIDPDGPEVPFLVVLGESRVRGTELLAADREQEDRRAEAEEFLLEELADGPRKASDIKAAASRTGHHWRTVERAKKKLGVKAKRTGGKGKEGKQGGGSGYWEWSL